MSEDKKAQLHQLLAVLPGLKGVAEKIHGETIKSFATKNHLFEGFEKVYEPRREEDRYAAAELSEHRPLAETIGGKLRHLAEHTAPYWDAEYQRDLANCGAKADLEIVTGDETIHVAGVPATYLLQLKKNLTNLRVVLNAIPTLDLSKGWKEQPEAGPGVYVADPKTNVRTQKVVQHKVVAPATEQHPAQVVTWNEDEVIGVFKTTHTSGLITPEQKYKLLKRVDIVLQSVVDALARANQCQHPKDKIAKDILDFITRDVK